MLKIGKLTFGTKAELIESLFNPVEGRTLNGIYKKRKNGIALNRCDGSPWMFLVANRWGERFFVSAFKGDDVRTRYMHGLTSSDEKAIGLSYSEEMQCASDVWETVCAREYREKLNS